MQGITQVFNRMAQLQRALQQINGPLNERRNEATVSENQSTAPQALATNPMVANPVAAKKATTSFEALLQHTLVQKATQSTPVEQPPTAQPSGLALPVAPVQPNGFTKTAPQTNRYQEEITEAARAVGLSPSLIKAVVQVESNFNPKAVSPKGAMGLMQLMPETAAQLGLSDAFDIRQNLRGGSRYLRSLLDRNGNNLVRALAAYNAGEQSLKNGLVPNYPETQGYVRKVLESYMRYNGVKGE